MILIESGLRSTRRRMSIAIILLAGLGVVSAARADSDSSTGITVTGTGEVKARPSLVIINATVRGEAELAADAIVKYRDAKRRATEMFDKLKVPGLSVESSGYAINKGVDANQQQMMHMRGGGAAAGAKQQVQIIEQIRLTLKDVDKLEGEKALETVLKVLDAARDAGLTIGSDANASNYYEAQMMSQSGMGPSMVSFHLPDSKALEAEAYKNAVADARGKAEKLAQQIGEKLGRVHSVSDAQKPGNRPQTYVMYNYGSLDRSEEDGLKSNLFGEIPVKVSLTVQYELAK